MNVTFPQDRNRKIATSISLTRATIDAIDAWSDRRGVNRSVGLTEIVDRYFAVTDAGRFPVGITAKDRDAIVAFLRDRGPWCARDFADVGLLARRTLGARLGAQVLAMPVGILAALIDSAEAT